MVLYLNAYSKKDIGYIPDWLQVTFEENERLYELTLDIQGAIDYDRDRLGCRCKGDLIPWTLIDCESGDETDLSEMCEEEIDDLYPNWKVAQIIDNGIEFLVGVYLVDDSDENFEYAKDDVLTDGAGYVDLFCGENNDNLEKEFSFKVETDYWK